MNFYLLPHFDFHRTKVSCNTIQTYLSEQTNLLLQMINDGIASASIFMNAQLCMSLLSIDSKNLLNKMNESLVVDEKCHAYSYEFASQLYKFEGQSKQNDVYTEYYHWIISVINGNDLTNQKINNIKEYVENSGYIYNKNNSDTQEKYRMKSELLSQTLMALEIFQNKAPTPKNTFRILEKKHITPYISAEYMRSRIAGLINRPTPHDKNDVLHLLENCKSEYGLCDFDSKNKKDDFMGSKKRSERDQTIFSPLATLHGIYLCETVGLTELKKDLIDETKKFFDIYSIDIPYYVMRDIPINFGPGNTILESIAMQVILSL